MNQKPWAIAAGDDFSRKAVMPTDGIGGFSTELEAVEAIIREMDGVIWSAKNSRKKAVARRAKLRGPARKAVRDGSPQR